MLQNFPHSSAVTPAFSPASDRFERSFQSTPQKVRDASKSKSLIGGIFGFFPALGGSGMLWICRLEQSISPVFNIFQRYDHGLQLIVWYPWCQIQFGTATLQREKPWERWQHGNIPNHSEARKQKDQKAWKACLSCHSPTSKECESNVSLPRPCRWLLWQSQEAWSPWQTEQLPKTVWGRNLEE